ncbi:MAG: pilus assembly protein PilM [Candidatus Sumerlaeia bacterium]|nr:pilus assembly protein PilM [Candidatus Sumerlaeia bacterium]
MPRTAAIELNENDAKVVQVLHSRKTGVQLEKAFRVAFATAAKDEEGIRERAARLKEALREHRLQATEIALVVPKQSATVRKVRLPSTDPAELASMARFEAEKIIPFNVERHIVTHALVATHGIEGSDVLLAAIDETVMDPLVQTLTAAGIEPAVADVSSLALATSVFGRLDETLARQCFAIAQVGWTHTDMTLFNNGEIVTTRSVLHGVRNLLADLQTHFGLAEPLGPEALIGLDALEPSAFRPGRLASPAPSAAGSAPAPFEILEAGPNGDAAHDPGGIVESWTHKLVTNLRRTYEFSLREYAIPPLKHVLITGEAALVRNLAPAVQAQLNVPVQSHNPLADVARAEKSDIDDRLLAAYAGAYGSALRLATQGEGGGINLLPPRLLAQRRQSEMMVHYVATGAMALVALLVVVLWMWSAGRYRSEQYRRYDEYTAELNELVRDIDDMRDRMRVIREIRSERAGALQILDGISQYGEIAESTNGGRVALTDFEFVLGVEVRIRGHALEIEDINKFVYYLKNLQNERGQVMFENVDVRSQNPTTLPRRDRTIYEFEIIGLLFLED